MQLSLHKLDVGELPDSEMEEGIVVLLARERDTLPERLGGEGDLARKLCQQSEVEGDDRFEAEHDVEQTFLGGRQGVQLRADGQDVGTLFGESLLGGKLQAD